MAAICFVAVAVEVVSLGHVRQDPAEVAEYQPTPFSRTPATRSDDLHTGGPDAASFPPRLRAGRSVSVFRAEFGHPGPAARPRRASGT